MERSRTPMRNAQSVCPCSKMEKTSGTILPSAPLPLYATRVVSIWNNAAVYWWGHPCPCPEKLAWVVIELEEPNAFRWVLVWAVGRKSSAAAAVPSFYSTSWVWITCFKAVPLGGNGPGGRWQSGLGPGSQATSWSLVTPMSELDR